MITLNFSYRSLITRCFSITILVILTCSCTIRVFAETSIYNNNYRSRLRKSIFLMKGGSSSNLQTTPPIRQSPSPSTIPSTPLIPTKPSITSTKPSLTTVPDAYNQDTRADHLTDPNTVNDNSVFWPPWPFSLLNKNNQIASSSSPLASKAASDFQTGAELFVAYTRQRAKLGLQQIQQVGSAMSFHLPAASPPLMLLAALPTTNRLSK